MEKLLKDFKILKSTNSSPTLNICLPFSTLIPNKLFYNSYTGIQEKEKVKATPYDNRKAFFLFIIGRKGNIREFLFAG